MKPNDAIWRKAVLLAHDNPDLRPHLLPLLKREAHKIADSHRRTRVASGFDEPEANVAFREALLDFANRSRGKIIKNDRSSVVFTFPKNEHVKKVRYGFHSSAKVPFWIENIDGVAGWGWDAYQPGKPSSPSNTLNYPLLQSRDPKHLALDIQGLIKALSEQLEEVRADSIRDPVRGLKQRPDLKKRNRGRSTNPNTYGDPTYYEVLGSNSPYASKSVLEWLQKNEKRLTPGTHHGPHGTWTEVSLEWDRSESAWFVVSRFWYTGD